MAFFSLSLTAGTDILDGSAADDTFFASAGTLNTFDQVDAGEGFDTLRVEGNQDITTGELTNFERIDVVGTPAGTYDVSGIEELEQLWFEDTPENADITVEGLTADQTVGAAKSVDDSDDGATTVYDVAAEVATGSVANLAVNDAAISYDVSVAAANTADTVDTLNISAAGGASNVAFAAQTTVDDGAGIDEVRNLTVNGGGDLVINAANLGENVDTDADGVVSVDATAATGDVELTLNTSSTATEVGLGSGDDVLVSEIDFSDSDVTIVGGEGNDTLVANATQLTALNNVGGANITGFETLGVSGASQNLNANTVAQIGFSAIALDGDLATGTTTITALEAGSNIVTLQDGADVDLDVAAKTGNDDAVGVTVLDDSSSSITVQGDIETLNIVTSDTNADDETTAEVADLSFTNASGDLESIVVTGDEAVKFDVSGLTGVETVDVSGITSDSSQADGEFAAEVTVAGATVTGSAGDDSITFGLNAEVTGGEGNDTFVLGYGSDESDTTFATIADFQQGDVIDFGAVVTGVAETTVTTAPGATATFQDYLDAASSTTAGQVNHFEFDGNTYLVFDADGTTTNSTFTAAEDELVELSGSVDLTGVAAVDADTANTVEIA